MQQDASEFVKFQNKQERLSGLSKHRIGLAVLLTLTLLAMPTIVLADDGLDSGDTAWMLTSTALVLFMTIPGLALFYGGLVRTKNVLSVLMQCFSLTGLMTILWIVCNYSLAFDTTGMKEGTVNLHSFVGRPKQGFSPRHIGGHPIRQYSGECLCYVPDDLCYNHARTYCGCVLQNA